MTFAENFLKIFHSKNNNNEDYEDEPVSLVKLEENPLAYNEHPDQVSSFNCGGFALQTLNWYVPSFWRKNRNDSFNSVEEIDEFVFKCADIMVEEYNDRYADIDMLVEVDHHSEVPIGIEVIGFRVASELYEDCEDEIYELDDFHFIWRDRKGNWWEKGGWSEVRELGFDPDDVWSNRYDSQIVWFARVAL